MDKEWVVLANASRARVCSRDPRDGALSELDDLVYPQARQAGREIGGSRAGRVEKDLGPAGHGTTLLSPHTELRQKQATEFARQIVGHIDDALAQRRCESWVLVAGTPFLGELRRALTPAASRALRCSLASDLTSYSDRDLERRVSELLLRNE